ncbi:MAG TPA: amphi-Trp domain-containing protein [Acidimicrobiales bacterium]
MDDLLEINENARMRREEAAERLRTLADMLARHNEVAFVREGLRYSVRVPDEVHYTFEVEIGEDGSEVEVEIKW